MRFDHCVLLTICVLMLTSANREVRADEPYCGLYSLHAALHAVGVEADLEEMIAPDYLSGSRGSTALELIRLAEKYKVRATYHSRMTLADLRSSKSPVLLHTSIAISHSGFHHWVLFLGMNGDSLRIYDPPGSDYFLSGAELLSQWDGTGVIVERLDRQSSISLPCPSLDTTVAVLLILLTGLTVVGFKALVRHPRSSILGVAIVSALAWHGIVNHGFLRNRYSVATIACRYEKTPLPTLSATQVREVSHDSHVTIIDARTPDAYVHSHLPGAINIPITVTHGALRDALASISVENRIIVYCQSEKCGFADAIAHQFPARGFRQVFVFRGGMEEWKAASDAVALKTQESE